MALQAGWLKLSLRMKSDHIRLTLYRYSFGPDDYRDPKLRKDDSRIQVLKRTPESSAFAFSVSAIRVSALISRSLQEQ